MSSISSLSYITTLSSPLLTPTNSLSSHLTCIDYMIPLVSCPSNNIHLNTAMPSMINSLLTHTYISMVSHLPILPSSLCLAVANVNSALLFNSIYCFVVLITLFYLNLLEFYAILILLNLVLVPKS